MSKSAAAQAVDIRALIRAVPDFPKQGIVYRDITPLLLDAAALAAATDALAGYARPLEIDYVVAAEARGFMLGGALAHALGAGFLPARKPGKLPAETVSAEYALEYGTDALEVHADRLEGARVLVHDDLLATGGTAAALTSLVERVGGTVAACAFLVELASLGGRERLAPHDVHSLVIY
jgi:adenine phosphoribosyltransferase